MSPNIFSNRRLSQGRFSLSLLPPPQELHFQLQKLKTNLVSKMCTTTFARRNPTYDAFFLPARL